jgi:hypothetical protein
MGTSLHGLLKSKTFMDHKQIDELYEEAKLCLLSLSILEEERSDYDRLFEIIKELHEVATKAIG